MPASQRHRHHKLPYGNARPQRRLQNIRAMLIKNQLHYSNKSILILRTSIHLQHLVIDPHPVRKGEACRWLHFVIIALVRWLECRSIEFMNWSLVCRQNLYFIKDQRIEIIKNCFIECPVRRYSVSLLFPPGNWPTRVNGDYGMISLKHNIISRTFDKCFASSSRNRVPAQLPRWSLQYVISEMILYLFIWVSELIDIVPQRVFTTGDRMPPAIESFPVFGKILFIFLQLKCQIVPKQGLLLVRIMNHVHHMPSHLLFTVIFAGIQMQ
jgi:hypothetical protein